MNRRLPQSLWFPGVLWWILALSAPAAARKEVNEEATSATTVLLKYRPDGFGLTSSPITFDRQTPFSREPDFAQRQVFRGALKMGGTRGDEIGLIWDKEKGQLHLDLNRNGDLADDPSSQGHANLLVVSNRQDFPNIVLASPLGPKHGLWAGQIALYRYGASPPSGYFMVCSGWMAKVNLHGRDRILGVTDSDGDVQTGVSELFLGTTDEALRPMDKIPFPGDQLFLDGHACKVSFELQPTNDGGVVAATFAHIDLPLGQCDIQGENIARLLLERAKPMKAVLDRPRGMVAIPIGTYGDATVFMERESDHKVFSAKLSSELSVAAGQPAVFRAGGPLRNIVEVIPAGLNRLQLGYKLVGVGGEPYQPETQDPSQMPGYAVYRGKRKIASGSFEYG